MAYQLAEQENNTLAIEVLKLMQDQPLSQAYCAGWIRHGLETPMHYALWLGYRNFDQGMPDQWFGRCPHRLTSGMWVRWADYDDRRQTVIDSVLELDVNAVDFREQRAELWNIYLRALGMCGTCGFIPNSRTRHHDKPDSHHHSNQTNGRFIHANTGNFQFPQDPSNSDYHVVSLPCLPRCVNLDGLFSVDNWFEVDPVMRQNHSLDVLLRRGLYYEVQSQTRTSKIGVDK